MVVIRKCIFCGNAFDAEFGSSDLYCESCSMKDTHERQVNPFSDMDPFSADDFRGRTALVARNDKNGYYRQRQSGSLAFIEREGEPDPGLSYEDMLDRIIQEAESKYQDTKNEEAQAIQNIFGEDSTNKFGFPKKNGAMKLSRNNDPVSPKASEDQKSTAQNDALTRFLTTLKA